MTTILLVIDGVGARSVSPQVMPTLTGWGRRGMARPAGATSVMCASTYPNFASLATGRPPADHGLFTNEALVDGQVKGAGEVGPAIEPIFDAGTEVIVGDHNLIGVTAADRAGKHWPPEGRIPVGTDLDMFGYVADGEVTARVVEALERGPDLLFVQLNSPDTYAHWYGPDSAEAVESYRALDSQLATIDTVLNLDRHLLLVTSDHDQETVDPDRRIDLASLAKEHGMTALHEGTAAMLVGPDAAEPRWVEEIPGVAECVLDGPGRWFVYSAPGWWFADLDFPGFRGGHGGPRTRRTIAVVAGPASALAAIAPRFRAPELGAADWPHLVALGQVAIPRE